MMAALPARGEDTCLRFLGLLESPPSRLARALPALGSANSADSVNSETASIMNRISNIAYFSDVMVLPRFRKL